MYSFYRLPPKLWKQKNKRHRYPRTKWKVLAMVLGKSSVEPEQVDRLDNNSLKNNYQQRIFTAISLFYRS